MEQYNKRTWLNPISKDASSSVVAFKGSVTDFKGKIYPSTFLEISDCQNKIRLHQTSDDSGEEFIEKIKLLKNEIELFINYLETYGTEMIENLISNPTVLSNTCDIEQNDMEQNLNYWKQLSFKELIEHGRNSGANIVNGMPWSWKINGKSVTHERDDLYLVECVSGIERVEEGDQIRAVENGLQYLPYTNYD